MKKDKIEINIEPTNLEENSKFKVDKIKEKFEYDRHKAFIEEVRALKELYEVIDGKLNKTIEKDINNVIEEIKPQNDIIKPINSEIPKAKVEDEEQQTEKKPLVKDKKRSGLPLKMLGWGSALLLFIGIFSAIGYILNKIVTLPMSLSLLLSLIFCLIVFLSGYKMLKPKTIKKVNLETGKELTKLCPKCSYRVQKGAVLEDEKFLRQIYKCKNPNCNYIEEIKFDR